VPVVDRGFHNTAHDQHTDGAQCDSATEDESDVLHSKEASCHHWGGNAHDAVASPAKERSENHKAIDASAIQNLPKAAPNACSDQRCRIRQIWFEIEDQPSKKRKRAEVELHSICNMSPSCLESLAMPGTSICRALTIMLVMFIVETLVPTIHVIVSHKSQKSCDRNAAMGVKLGTTPCALFADAGVGLGSTPCALLVPKSASTIGSVLAAP